MRRALVVAGNLVAGVLLVLLILAPSRDLTPIFGLLAAPASIGEVLDSRHRALGEEGRRAAQAVRAKVSEDSWQAFYLTVCEGRPGAEVAKRLGKTPGSVYQAAYRVGNMLREESRRLGERD